MLDIYLLIFAEKCAIIKQNRYFQKLKSDRSTIMKNTQNWHTVYIIAMFILTLVFFVAIVKLTDDIWINVIFISVMVAFLILHYAFALKNIRTLVKDFDNASKKVNEYSQKENKLRCLIDDKELFHSKYLSKAFSEYKKELQRMDSEESATIRPDIRDYFNEELLDSVLMAEISEQIPGVMTGLGILGTFIGLTVGLNKFSLGSDIDTSLMQTSISGLLEGIKTAFITSIFGVVYSLAFNFFYKKIYISVCEEMNEFIVCYESEMISSPQNDLLTSFVRSQEIQTESLRNFADNIAAAMAKQINDLLQPTVENLNSSVDNFFNKSVRSQDESLGIIVNTFVDKMNSSLGNQFEELGKTISELNSKQIESNEKIQAVVDTICQNAAGIASVNNSLESSLQSLNRLLDKMDDYQANTNRANETLLNRIDTINAYNDRQADALANLEKAQIEFNETADRIRQCLDEYNRISSDFGDSSAAAFDSLNASINSFDELNCEFIADFKAALIEEIKAGTAATAEQNQLISDTFAKAVKSSGEILDAQIQKANEISSSLNKSMTDSAKALREAYRDMESNVYVVLKKTYGSFDETMAEITRHLNGTIASYKNTIDELNDYSSDLPTKLYSIIEKMIGELTAVINELKAVNPATTEESETN